METIKKVLAAVAGFVVFVIFIMMIVEQATDLIELKKSEVGKPAEAIVVDKTIFRDLYGKMYYLALLEEGASEKVSVYLSERSNAEVTKKEYDKLSTGDVIKGYDKYGTFYSKKDAKESHWEHWIMLFVLSIYPLFYSFYQLLKWEKFENLVNRYDKSLGRIFSTIFIGGLVVGLLFSYGSMVSSLKNVILSNTGDSVERDAIILDGQVDYGSGRYSEDSFYLAIAYIHDGEMMYMTKEVTRNDYNEYSYSLPIRYPSDQPHHVTVTEFSWKDFQFIVATNKFIIYILTIVLTALLIFAANILHRKKKERASYKKRNKNKKK